MQGSQKDELVGGRLWRISSVYNIVMKSSASGIMYFCKGDYQLSQSFASHWIFAEKATSLV